MVSALIQRPIKFSCFEVKIQCEDRKSNADYRRIKIFPEDRFVGDSANSR